MSPRNGGNSWSAWSHPFSKEGLRIGVNVLIGTPFLKIIHQVLRQKHDLVIMAAVDPICTGEEKNLLNIKIMELATSLAKLEQSELHIVHAWNFRGDDLLAVRGRMSGETIDQLANQTRAIHKKGFDELIGSYALKNLNHRLHFLKGDPAALITDLAAEHRIDLIVMGTVCRTGVAGFFIGNTAENVLQECIRRPPMMAQTEVALAGYTGKTMQALLK